MPILSQQLRTDYIEMINDALDAIRVRRYRHFNTLTDSLNQLLHHNYATLCQVNYAFPEDISTVAEYLQHPEMYLTNIEQREEYMAILTQRIQAKIRELESMNLKERFAYIRAQEDKEQKQAAIKNYVASNEHKRPVHQSYMQTEEEVLHNLQIWYLMQDYEEQRQLHFQNHRTASQETELVVMEDEEDLPFSDATSNTQLSQDWENYRSQPTVDTDSEPVPNSPSSLSRHTLFRNTSHPASPSRSSDEKSPRARRY